MRAVDSFFPGHRMETIITGVNILKNAAGEKRLKLTMTIPLNGQLVAMPDWIGEPFTDIVRPEHKIRSIKSRQELDPMLLSVFHLPQSAKEKLKIDSVRMCAFKLEGEDDSDSARVMLTFSAYLPRTGPLLKWADDNFGASLFIRFEAAQMALLDENPVPQDARSANKDDDEDEDEEGEDDEELIPETTLIHVPAEHAGTFR